MLSRRGFYFIAIGALGLGFFLIHLWQPEFQVRKHSEHVMNALTAKDWKKFATFIGTDYSDQWGNNRSAVLERTRGIFGYAGNTRVRAIEPDIRVEDRTAYWRALIVIEGGENNEIATEMRRRVNELRTRFELEWHRMSNKPWDWRLVKVRNPGLLLPEE